MAIPWGGYLPTKRGGLSGEPGRRDARCPARASSDCGAQAERGAMYARSVESELERALQLVEGAVERLGPLG